MCKLNILFAHLYLTEFKQNSAFILVQKLKISITCFKSVTLRFILQKLYTKFFNVDYGGLVVFILGPDFIEIKKIVKELVVFSLRDGPSLRVPQLIYFATKTQSQRTVKKTSLFINIKRECKLVFHVSFKPVQFKTSQTVFKLLLFNFRKNVIFVR